MNRIIMVCAALTSLLLILPIPTHSAPVITGDWAFIDNRAPDDIFSNSGLRLNLTVRATDAGGVPALTGPGSGATVVSSNPGFPYPTPRNVPLNAVFPIIGGAEFTTLPALTGESQFSKVTGTYTFRVTNTSLDWAESTSHNLDKPDVIDLPTGLAFSNYSTTPVFSFTDPDPTPDITGLVRRYQVDIFDATTKTNIYQSPSNLTLPLYEVPPGILEVGKSYYFRADIMDIDSTETGGTIHSRLENRAIEYATFRAVPEPSIMLLLGSGLIGLAGFGRKKFLKK